MYCGISGGSGVLGNAFIKFCKNKNYKFVRLKGDIRRKKNLISWLSNEKINYIIHFAAIVPVKKVENNFSKALDVNVNSIKNILDLLKKKKRKTWFFLASTSHVYSFSKKKVSETSKVKPINKYGYTKYLAEKVLLNKKNKKYILPCVGRIFSYTNFNQNTKYLIPSLYRKKKVKIESINHIRDFIHIDDICSAIHMLKIKKRTGIYNIGSGRKTHLIDLYNKIKKKNINKPKTAKTEICSQTKKLKNLGWKAKKNIFDILIDYKKKYK